MWRKHIGLETILGISRPPLCTSAAVSTQNDRETISYTVCWEPVFPLLITVYENYPKRSH